MATKKNLITSSKRSSAPGSAGVLQFLKDLKHPLKIEIDVVRRIILDADKKLEEHIKWNVPTLHIGGEDRITFIIRGNADFGLIFHCGTTVKETKGKKPFFEDTTGMLQWISDIRAMVKFSSMAEVKGKKKDLKIVVKKWIEAAKRLTKK